MANAGRGHILRTALLHVVDHVPHTLVILAAPSGYGKTVLAAQAVAADERQTTWIDLTRQVLGRHELLRLITAETVRAGAIKGTPDYSSESIEALEAHLRVQLETTLPRYLVLDDLALTDCSLEDLRDLERLVRQASPLSQILVTTRDSPDGLPHVPLPALVVSHELLKFTRAEVQELVDSQRFERVNKESISLLLEHTKGQPALVCLTLPYMHCLGDGQGLTKEGHSDFSGIAPHLLSLTHQFSESQILALYAASVVGRGSVGDLAALVPGVSLPMLKRMVSAIPLFHLDEEDASFYVHDIAQLAFLSAEFVDRLPAGTGSLTRRIVSRLADRRAYPRLAYVLDKCLQEDERACVLAEYGDALVSHGLLTATRGVIERIDSRVLIRFPRVILLHARILREHGMQEEAESRASIARQLAEADGDNEVVAESVLLDALSRFESGKEEEAEVLLADALRHEHQGLSMDSRALAYGLHALAAAVIGKTTESEASLEAMSRMIHCQDVSSGVVGRLRLYAGSIQALVYGDWLAALKDWNAALGTGALSRIVALSIRGNIAAALCELGRLDCAQREVDAVLRDAADLGLRTHINSYTSVKGGIAAARGDYDLAIDLMREAISGAESVGDLSYAYQDRLYLGIVLRARGDYDGSLRECEVATSYATSQANTVSRISSAIESAASLTAYGDVSAARTLLESVEDRLGERRGIAGLKLAMIRAVLDGPSGDTWLAEHLIAYLKSGNANWQTAMYCRGLPAVAPLVGAWLGGWTGAPVGLRALTANLSNCVGSYDIRQSNPPVPISETLSIGMFGTFEVHAASRVDSRSWRKRKARVLFAMLAVKRGQDVPRDQILEHLWPEMDADRARNNFYVVWSAMKSALMGGAGKRERCPYVENVGGVCRIVRENVRLDLDDFDEQLERARREEAAGNREQAIEAYERLADLYRGELLPSDLYDDWFVSAREHYRQEFSAAMLQGARLRANGGDADGALRFVRAALAHDPWREDLYQAAIRYQMRTGQRGAAIETYLACRSRLADDLGLDPSAETRGLYDEILAMEETPQTSVAS